MGRIKKLDQPTLPAHEETLPVSLYEPKRKLVGLYLEIRIYHLEDLNTLMSHSLCQGMVMRCVCLSISNGNQM